MSFGTLVSATLFLDFYLVAPWLTLHHYQGDTLTHLMLMTAFLQFWYNIQVLVYTLIWYHTYCLIFYMIFWKKCLSLYSINRFIDWFSLLCEILGNIISSCLLARLWFSNINLLQKSYICRLDSVRLCPFCETQRITDRNGV